MYPCPAKMCIKSATNFAPKIAYWCHFYATTFGADVTQLNKFVPNSTFRSKCSSSIIFKNYDEKFKPKIKC